MRRLKTNEVPAKNTGFPSLRQYLRRRWFFPYGYRRIGHIVLGVTLAASVILLPLWVARSTAGTQMEATMRARIIDWSVRAGFRVNDVLVEGRNRTPRDELRAALHISRNDPMFAIDMDATRQRLEEISWVKTASLERHLPDEIHVIITEREPIARWQNQGHYYLVDEDGLVVGDQVDDFPALPLIVGEGAPDQAHELKEMLASEPELAKRVKAAQWISERRWNLSLDLMSGGIDVRLPEKDAVAAFHELARLDRESSLLERKISLVDMRLPDRLMLRTTGGAEESAVAAHAQSAKQKNIPGKDA